MYVLINFVCMKTDEIKTEIHPLEPFFPQGARLLMMGSFPPKRERWKMDFYYPNFQNGFLPYTLAFVIYMSRAFLVC